MIKMKTKHRQMVKRVVPLLLAAVMVLGVFASALSSMTRVYASDLAGGVQNSAGSIYLSAASSTIRPGRENDVRITFYSRYSSEKEITNIEVSCDGSDIFVTNSISDFKLTGGGQASKTVTLDVADTAEEGSYTMDVTFQVDGESYNRTLTFNVSSRVSTITVPSTNGDIYTEIEGSVAQPRMDIEIGSTTPDSCKEGDTITLAVLLSYYKTAISARVGTISVSSEAFAVVDGMVTRNLQYERASYSGPESYTKAVKYQLQAKDSLASGYYPITVKVDYYDDEETQKYTVENTYNIYVEGTGKSEDGSDTAAATPFLIVEQYDYGSQDVVAGDTFDLRFSIKNTGYLPVENILVAITAPEALAITSSSNTLYIASLSAGASSEQLITFRAKANADPGSHAIDIKFSYQYLDQSTRKEGNTQESIAIPVIQQDRFFVNDLEPPQMIYAGEENMIEVTFINKGTTEVRNISAEISGNMANPGQSQYIGNLQPGAENSADFTLQALEPGQMNGTVLLTYEDSNGTQREITKEFTVEVMEMPVYDVPMDPGMMGPVDEGFVMPFWGWLAIGVGGVVVVIVVAVVVTKKVKAAKKKQEEEDEDF